MVGNVEEAVQWLSYTYFFVRMHLNPMVYGIPYGAKKVQGLPSMRLKIALAP